MTVLRFLTASAAYREKEDLIAVGAYQEGSDPVVDQAIRMRDPIGSFLRQEPHDLSAWPDTLAGLDSLAQAMNESAGAVA